jgi:hypothetical protein
MRFRLPALRFPVLSGALAVALAASQLSAQMPKGIGDSLSNLASQPATHTGFVFDRSMLQAARGVLQAGGMTPDRAAAALSSVSFDTYRYGQPVVYTPEAMAPILAAYHTAGWKHLVDAHDLKAGAATHRGTATDLWLHFTGMDIDGVTVLTRGSHEMSLIQVACDLRPLDLVHLSGHFGIPKVDSNAVMVPDPNDR